MKVTNPTVRADRRYRQEFAAAVVLYLVVLFLTRGIMQGVRDPWEVAVALAPLGPVVLMFLAALRWWKNTDEFNKQLVLQSLAIAGVVTALAAVTYGFLENDRLPRPSAWWTYVSFMFSWLVATQILRLRYR